MVNRSAFQLTLYKKLKPVKTYGIAVGQVGLETPAGLYTVQNKAVNPAWSVPNSAWAGSLAGTVVPGGTPQNPLKARWLGIYNGAGIHGTDAAGSIGTAASHGCIRMLIPDVIELYDQVPVNAPVYIALARAASVRRRRPDLGRRHLLPALLQQGGVMGAVAKSERADEDPALPLAQHRVPHRRRVAGALDPVPRSLGQPMLVGRARRVQLPLGGDLTGGGVDEERGHGRVAR